MSRFNEFNSDEIIKILNEEDNPSLGDSASEVEDNEVVEDLPSEDENNYAIIEIEPVPTTIGEVDLTIDNNHALRLTNSERIYRVSGNTLCSKNGHVWSTNKGSTAFSTGTINIAQTSRGPAGMCKNAIDPLQIFCLFITDEIIAEIVKWTNVEIAAKTLKVRRITTIHREVTDLEIRAFMGILTLSAVMKNNNLSTTELFDSTFSCVRYTAAMSKERFEFLVRCLRMDDKTLRTTLGSNDAFLPARNVWELFIKQCQTNYIPGSEVTIGEQFIRFRGKCPFRSNIPNKPNKYGIKFPTMCDATSKYMIDADPYIGRITNTEDIPPGEFYVKKLSKTIHGSNRNITCSQWFTSVPLAKSLLQEPYNLTLVGNIRSNKEEIPEELKNSSSRPIGTSMYCFDGHLTLMSYKLEPARMVYLLSSCNENAAINDSSGKPDIYRFYNQTKGGVDSFDQMCSAMSCSRQSNRWPMTVFYGILNMAFVNSAIIYGHNMIKNNQKPLNRREFMKCLSTGLISPWMEKRLEAPSLKRSLRENISQILEKPVDLNIKPQIEVPQLKKRKYCSFCTYKRKRMSKLVCYKCQKSVCCEHKVDVCIDCF